MKNLCGFRMGDEDEVVVVVVVKKTSARRRGILYPIDE